MLNRPSYLRKKQSNVLIGQPILPSNIRLDLKNPLLFQEAKKGVISPSQLYTELLDQSGVSSPQELSAASHAILATILVAFMSQVSCASLDSINDTYEPSRITKENVADASVVPEEKSSTFDLSKARLSLNPNKDKPTNVLDAYPEDKKLAIIINGDDEEERHIKNVKRAIKVLSEKGFKRFYVASTQSLEESDKDKKISKYEGSSEGVDKLFEELEKDKGIKKDDLVFFYATGHGDRNDKNGTCISLTDHCYDHDTLVEKLQLIKKQGAQGIFVVDTCFSGSVPAAIADSGLKGIALSPAAEEKLVGCTAFTPILFENIRSNRDLNGDGFSEPVEWFRTAMANYQTQVPMANEGTFIEPRPELSSELLQKYRKTGQTLIIELGATWCPPCREFDPILHQVNSMIGEQVEILQITTDTNSESAGLLKELDAVGTPLPTTVVIQPDGTMKTVTGAMSAENLLLELNGAGVAINKDLYKEVITSEENPPHSSLILKHATKYASESWAEPIIRKAAKENPMSVLEHLTIDPKYPWFEDLIKKALETDIREDECGWGRRGRCTLKYAHVYAHTDWGRKKILEAVDQQGIDEKLDYLEGYADQPWAEDVVKRVLRRDQLEVIWSIKHFADQPWAESIIGPLFPRNISWLSHEIEHFASQPWAGKYITEAARKKPQYILPEIEHYVDQPWTEPLLKELSDNHPALVLAYSYVFEDRPYYQEIVPPLLEKVDGKTMKKLAKTRRHACSIFSSGKAYKNKEWGEDVLKTSSRKAETDCVAKNFNTISGYDWAEPVANRIVNGSPEYLVRFYDKFEGQNWTDELLSKAIKGMFRESNSYLMSAYFNIHTLMDFADNYPEVVLEHSSEFEDQPNGDIIIKRAQMATKGRESKESKE